MNNLIVSEIEIHYKNIAKGDQKITESKETIPLFRAVIDYNNKQIDLKEYFYALYLNRDNIVLACMLISEGGTAGTVVDTKLIASAGLKINAHSVILCHNHPSGNTNPSEADKGITIKIKEGLKLLDMRLLDHIIITSKSHFSIAEQTPIFNL